MVSGCSNYTGTGDTVGPAPIKVQQTVLLVTAGHQYVFLCPPVVLHPTKESQGMVSIEGTNANNKAIIYHISFDFSHDIAKPFSSSLSSSSSANVVLTFLFLKNNVS
jgi:hypothetical protein